MRIGYNSETKFVGLFIPPTLSLVREDCTKMIKLSSKNVMEPLYRILFGKELTEYTKEWNAPGTKLQNYPWHTQAVNKCIKLVNDQPKKFMGSNNVMNLSVLG